MGFYFKYMSDKYKLLILIGIPGSGKTTYSTLLLSKEANYIRVNKDDIRKMLYNNEPFRPNIEPIVSGINEGTIENALNSGMNVVVDNTNCNIDRLIRLLGNLEETVITYFEYEIILFDVPLELCKLRNSNRVNPVGEEDMNKYYNDYLKIEGWCKTFFPKDSYKYYSDIVDKIEK